MAIQRETVKQGKVPHGNPVADTATVKRGKLPRRLSSETTTRRGRADGAARPIPTKGTRVDDPLPDAGRRRAARRPDKRNPMTQEARSSDSHLAAVCRGVHLELHAKPKVSKLEAAKPKVPKPREADASDDAADAAEASARKAKAEAAQAEAEALAAEAAARKAKAEAELAEAQARIAAAEKSPTEPPTGEGDSET